MIGTIRVINIIFLALILSGCTKTVCVSDSVWIAKCEKKLDWNNKGFTLFRTVVTNGANIGK